MHEHDWVVSPDRTLDRGQRICRSCYAFESGTHIAPYLATTDEERQAVAEEFNAICRESR